MKESIRIIKALSDPSRVKILKMLEHKSTCVCEIRSALGLAQPTVSKHLKTLEDAGIVSYRKQGLWVNDHLIDTNENPYTASLLESLRNWLDDDPEVRRLVERLPFISREDICRKP
jgi:ArsR family transcriptional regulator, arsenate/arsenite/antimonite-responsive transcriptional repressor